MRIVIILLLSVFIVKLCIGQTPPKKEVKKNLPNEVPSKTGMQAQMNEAINELNKQIVDIEKQITEAKKNKEDDSVIKNLEDQAAMLKKQVELMGGVTKSISNISDKEIQQALDDDHNTGVPKKDAARIKQVPGKILTDAELALCVNKIYTETDRLLGAKEKAEALEIFNAAKSEKKSFNYINNIASTLWLSGYTEMAIYVLGKACVADMTNSNNLNNYAAFLIMAGAEHAALPILQNLNQRFPGNSTILNNISQAWYGLGDMNNANRYLDSTVKIYRNHSQANQTKSKIQKSEGKTQESIESLKRSLEENYTTEKEARLNELGYKVKFEDVKFRYPMKAEPLGIERFMFGIPAYPFQGGYEAEFSRKEWYDFNTKIRTAIEALEIKEEVQKTKVDAYHKRLLDNPLLLKPYNNKVCKTSGRKLELLTEWGLERTLDLSEEFKADGLMLSQLRTDYDNASRNTESCGGKKGLATTFMSQANPIWQDNNARMLSLQKQIINAGSNYALYAYTDRSEYELILTTMKINFLTYLGGMHCEIEVGCLATETPASRRGPLPDFDSLTCNYRDTIFIPPFTTIMTECNKMSTKFDVGVDFGPVAVGVKAGMEENLNSGKITKGTLELGADGGFDEFTIGPLKAEAKLQGAIGVEITQEGLTEAYIKGGAVGEFGVDATGDLQSNPTINAGVEAKVSWNAGERGQSGSINSSLTGQGALRSINIVSTPIKL